MTDTPPETATDTSSDPARPESAGFAGLNLEPRLLKALEALGHSRPTDVQQQALPAALEGRDLAVSAETGSGKTAAYLLPTLQRLLQRDAPKSGTRALILTPTRELCRQVVKHCKQLVAFTHLQVNAIAGGHDFKYQKALFRKNPEIIVATPGRLREHLEKGVTDFDDLEVLILDEADRMLDMGFMDDVLTIANACNPQRQTLLFSATLDAPSLLHKPEFERLLSDPLILSLAAAVPVGDRIRQRIVLSDDDKHKNQVLLRLLQDNPGKVMVFTNTRAQAGKLAGWLRYKDIDAGVLHGEMLQEERNNSMNRLRRSRSGVLVATDVAARGLDIQGLDLVINYDLARNLDDFIHRTGRTARAGASGDAISFITHRDWDRMARFERELGLSVERLKIPGLEARFKGPDKVKSSGKRAGSKKRAADARGSADRKGGDKKKVKKRHRDQKNVGKRRSPSAKTVDLGDGFSPPPRRPPPRRSD